MCKCCIKDFSVGIVAVALAIAIIIELMNQGAII